MSYSIDQLRVWTDAVWDGSPSPGYSHALGDVVTSIMERNAHHHGVSPST